eukprot:11174100-Lingulodinium_polyedra.AAC.1
MKRASTKSSLAGTASLTSGRKGVANPAVTGVAGQHAHRSGLSPDASPSSGGGESHAAGRHAGWPGVC